MRYMDALKALDGESVGGQLIVRRHQKSVIVGNYVGEQLVVADTDDAREVMASLSKRVTAEITEVAQASRRGRYRKDHGESIIENAAAAVEPEPEFIEQADDPEPEPAEDA